MLIIFWKFFCKAILILTLLLLSSKIEVPGMISEEIIIHSETHVNSNSGESKKVALNSNSNKKINSNSTSSISNTSNSNNNNNNNNDEKSKSELDDLNDDSSLNLQNQYVYIEKSIDIVRPYDYSSRGFGFLLNSGLSNLNNTNKNSNLNQPSELKVLKNGNDLNNMEYDVISHNCALVVVVEPGKIN